MEGFRGIHIRGEFAVVRLKANRNLVFAIEVWTSFDFLETDESWFPRSISNEITNDVKGS